MTKQWSAAAAALALSAAMILCAQAKAQGGQSAPPQPASGELTGLAHIALRVSDLDREVDFFGKLGFEEAFSNVDQGRILQVFIKVNDVQFIEVYPQTDSAQPLGFMHACFESGDLKALYARYSAAGLRPTPVRMAGAGNLLSTMKDPQGRVVEFTQYMPDSRHMRDKGEHLGERRISDELLGFELPVDDVAREQKFYEALGFDAEPEGANVRLSIPANPDLRIELHPAKVNGQPQFLFPVDDARRAAGELHGAGLKVVREKKLVFVRDPDGNAFVLLETGGHSPRRLIPWRR
ncbi:MAG TPA: VOC family protein [Terracidiphilus sp.]|nr:VOC family protein [Terracidiphilus sp.]